MEIMESKENGDIKSKRPGIKIREMEIDDLAKVYHLGEELFTAEYAPSMYRTWDQYEIAGLFNSDSEFCLVAEADDEIVGFALGTIITKTGSAWKYGYLIWLGVTIQFQRQGVAEKLCHKFKDIMLKNGVRMLLVDTPAENLPALHLFRRLGFGHPRQHIHLTMNLDAEYQRLKRNNGEIKHLHNGKKTSDAKI
ncbi:MAG: GNAT family N-acetyltransferase [Desulfobacterales bacterium]|nr:MAG: GNAT family N-acetyltransferase [Desulfobacterales bacterium]